MPRAKSRLSQSTDPSTDKYFVGSSKNEVHDREKSTTSKDKSATKVSSYLSSLPTLVTGVLFFGIAGWQLLNVQPATVRSIIPSLPYVTVIFPLWLGISFICSYLVQRSLIGFIVGSWVAGLLYLRVLGYEVNLAMVAFLGLFCAAFILLTKLFLTFIWKR